MTDAVMVYFDHPYATESTTSDVPFDNTVLARLVDADVGVPVTCDGEPLLDVRSEEMFSFVEQRYQGVPIKTSSAFHERFAVTDDHLLSTRIRLPNGEQVDLSAYDIVLVSHFWAYYYYVRHLTEELTGTPVVGIQEESVQDVMASSSRLQLDHQRGIESLDGYIVSDDRYASLVRPFIDDVLKVELPVPEGHFEAYSRPEERRDVASLGVGILNIDFSNFYANLLVLDGVRGRGHDTGGEFVGVHEHHEPMISAYVDQRDYVTARGFLEDGFYDYLSRLRFAIVLTGRTTAGRVSAELAGLGVPCVGSSHVDLQQFCWPELSVETYAIDEAVKLTDKLLCDDTFYEQVVATAQEAVSELQRHHKPRERLSTYLDSLVERNR